MHDTNTPRGRLHFLMLPGGQPLVFPRRKIAPGEREFALDQPMNDQKFWPRAMVTFRDFDAATQTVLGIGHTGITIRAISSADELDELVQKASGVRYLGLREGTSIYHVPVYLMRRSLAGSTTAKRAMRGPRAGHAPAHIREMFLDAIEDARALQDARPFVEAFGSPERVERPGSDRERAGWLCRQLWNCTDVLLGAACDDLDIPRGSTFARAARLVKRGL